MPIVVAVIATVQVTYLYVVEVYAFKEKLAVAARVDVVLIRAVSS
jgi:hypothetical protein